MINIERETAIRLEKEGVKRETTFRLFSLGLINDQTAKRYLIIDTYKKAEPERGKHAEKKEEIADNFSVSSATVHSYLFRK